jgi:hypothetical protein
MADHEAEGGLTAADIRNRMCAREHLRVITAAVESAAGRQLVFLQEMLGALAQYADATTPRGPVS